MKFALTHSLTHSLLDLYKNFAIKNPRAFSKKFGDAFLFRNITIIVLLFSACLISCDSKKLTRNKAKKMINEYNPGWVHGILIGEVTDTVDRKDVAKFDSPCFNLNERYEPLVKDGYLNVSLLSKKGNRGWFSYEVISYDITCNVQPISKLQPFIKSTEDLSSLKQKIIRIIIASEELKEITGILPLNSSIDGRTISSVEYTYTIKPTPPGRYFYTQDELVTIQKGTMQFVLYDNGWRIGKKENR
ncbi:MAG: hypothetical protein Q8J64_04105 [Thermodesulfovibrionales bacterium]|nr:hypothetical protein [Thermodesulfovibrionales bacterium]